MKKITSIAQLKQEIEIRIKKAMEMTRDEIYNVVLTNVYRYYDEYDPITYSRTDNLLDSFIEADRDVKAVDGGFSFKIGWEDDYLEFVYPDTFRPRTRSKPTGLQVLEMFNGEYHGANCPHSILKGENNSKWDKSIAELGGIEGISNILEKNLAKVGLKQ